MGDESGGGGGPSGSSTRGQVGLTKKEQNVRATAQEPVRGGRVGAAPSRSRESGFASDASRSQEGDRFVTSTEGAFRDLNTRATKGQISERVMNVLPGTSILNEMGKKVATSIQGRISAGGTPVYDSIGRIQGVVETKDTPFGKGDVYTGSSSYSPVGTGKKAQPGIGYVMSAADVQASERLAGGGDGGDGGISQTSTAATATNVTGSTTTLSNAARRQALQGAAGGASRRQFI